MKKTAVALLALSVASSAFAYDFSGFYLGGNLGQTQYHKTVRLQATENGKVNEALTTDLDKSLRVSKGVAYGLHAGYHVNDWFSVELGWTKFADNSYKFLTDNVVRRHKANAVDLQAKFNYFNDLTNLNFFAGVGVAGVRNTLDQGFFTYNDATYRDIKKWRVAPVASAGVEYYFTKSFSVGAEYKVFINSYKAAGNAARDQRGLTLGNYTTSASTAPSETAPTKEVLVTNNVNKYKPTVHFLSANVNYHYGMTAPAPVAPVEIVTTHFVVKSETLFATNKYNLNPAKVAEALGDVVKAYNQDKDGATVKVVGHADRTGNKAKNLVLSQKRAQSVGTYLVQQGIDSNRLTVEGVGSSQPVTNGCYDVKNRTALRACLAPDRRVDVFVSGKKQTTKK